MSGLRRHPVTEERPGQVGWKDALARQRAPVRVATTAGALAATWTFGALFLDAGGWSAVAALAGPAAAVAIWLSVASARDPGPHTEALLRYLVSIAHPLAVLAIAIGASMGTGGGRGLPDLVWTMAVTLAVNALASWHRERRGPDEAPPALRRVTLLGVALLVLGHALLHMPDLLPDTWAGDLRWWGLEIGVARSTVLLALAIGALSATSIMRARAARAVPIGWLGALGVLWAWTAGWTGATVTGLLLPALALSAAVLLSPLLAPRLAPGEPLEAGTVAAGTYALAAAWAAAIAAPGSVPEMVGAPASSVTTLRYGLATLLAYQVRDLIVWSLMVRLAPRERWTGALWVVWMVVSWVIGGEGLRAIGAGWAIASIVGIPWGALEEATGPNGMLATMAAASLFSAAVAAGACTWLALKDRRAESNA